MTATGFRFFTGTHMPNWLWDGQVDMPLFPSVRTIAGYGYFAVRPAVVPWSLDSGGFTELLMHGEWRMTPEVYCRIVADLMRHIGGLDWAAPMDMMCEPEIIHGGWISGRLAPGTGLSVYEHQLATIANFITLVELWPTVTRHLPCPFIPVLQGWDPIDYLVCEALYYASGVDLTRYRIVGLGSICRRQHTPEIGRLIDLLADRYPLHCFGVKKLGLLRYGHKIASADSASWSYDARRNPPLAGCTHKSCANCPRYATRWTTRLLADLERADERGHQDALFTPVTA